MTKRVFEINESEKIKRKKCYKSLLPIIRTAARQKGYAIGVHGSEETDFDLMAMPWTEDAEDPEQLVTFITQNLKNSFPNNPFITKWPSVTSKPHGRLAFTIVIGFGHYENIDLSVAPRV